MKYENISNYLFIESYILLNFKQLFKLKTKNDTKEEIINEFRYYILNQDENTLDEIYNILL